MRFPLILLGVILSLSAWAQQSSAPAWSTVTMPVYFAYAPSPEQVQPPAAGPYKFYFPGLLSAPVPDALGCAWNVPGYDAPPYWFDDGVAESGPIYRSAPAVGTMYQSGTAIGSRFRGFQFTGAFAPGNFSDQTYLIGAVYYSANPCFAGDLEYGFGHDYIGGTTAFYFSNYSNCPESGSLLCYAEDTTSSPVEPQCSGQITLPSLPPNSRGTPVYLYSVYVSRQAGSGDFVFTAAVRDPYDHATQWACVADPANGDGAFDPCVGTFPVNSCGSAFPTGQLYETFGNVVAGISRDNLPGPSTAVDALQIATVSVGK
ncbi:MAG TPA: hypothetical protein VMI94_15785 [Bryobacteraceae bacterium]|nr:hypothetical protein [Bryobacteraceae bacterium]